MTPTATEATTSGMTQSPTPSLRASEGRCGLSARKTLLQVEGEETGEHVERPVSHVDDPHQPEDQREAARHDEIEPRECDAVQCDDDEDARVLGGLVGDPGHHERENRGHERAQSERSGRNRQQPPSEREVAIGGGR